MKNIQEKIDDMRKRMPYMRKLVLLGTLGDLKFIPDFKDAYNLGQAINMLRRAHPRLDVESFLHQPEPLGTSIYSILLDFEHIKTEDPESTDDMPYYNQIITKEAVETLDRILAPHD